jgi:hypothetical protein
MSVVLRAACFWCSCLTVRTVLFLTQPAPLEDKKEEKKERVQTVELSTTAKARAKAKAKGGDDAAMVDTPAASPVETEDKKPAAEEKRAFAHNLGAACLVR